MVEKTPRSSLWVSVTAHPPHQGGARQDLAVYVTDPSQRCEAEGANWIVPLGQSEWQPVFVATTVVDGRIGRTAACAESDRVLVAVAGQGTTGPGGGWDAELSLVEEPAVTVAASLPPADRTADLSTTSRWRGAADATDVTGGTSFSDAPTLGAGVYADTIVPGERLLYRVPAEFGQQIRAALYFPRADPTTSNALNPYATGEAKGLEVGGQLYGPTRATLSQDKQDLIVRRTVQGLRDTSLALKSPEIRYLNRTVPRLLGASVGGDYFIEVDAAKDDGGQTYTIPFQLNVVVEGDPSGEPAYEQVTTEAVSATAGPEPVYPDDEENASGAETDDGETSWMPIAAIGSGTAAVVVAILLAARLLRH